MSKVIKLIIEDKRPCEFDSAKELKFFSDRINQDKKFEKKLEWSEALNLKRQKNK